MKLLIRSLLNIKFFVILRNLFGIKPKFFHINFILILFIILYPKLHFFKHFNQGKTI